MYVYSWTSEWELQQSTWLLNNADMPLLVDYIGNHIVLLKARSYIIVVTSTRRYYTKPLPPRLLFILLPPLLYECFLLKCKQHTHIIWKYSVLVLVENADIFSKRDVSHRPHTAILRRVFFSRFICMKRRDLSLAHRLQNV